MRRLGWFPLLFVLPLALVAGGESQLRLEEEALICSAARRYLVAIVEKDAGVIADLVPERGLSNGDAHVTKSAIEHELADAGSWLWKILTLPVSEERIAQCAEAGRKSITVSPGAFSRAYGRDFSLVIKPVEGVNGIRVDVLAEPTKKLKHGCQFSILPIPLMMEGGKVFFYRYPVL